MLIMKIYMNYVNNGSNSISYDELKDLYKCRSAFKRSIKYLIDSKYVYSQRIKYNRVIYSLTLTGEFLARILCNMIDLPDEIRRMKWKFLW